MVWRFLKHYGMSKATDVLDEFASAVVAFDPDVASRAQVQLMEVELQKLGKRLAEAEAEVLREHRETAALRKTYDDYLEAARLLEAKLGSRADGSDQAGIEASLGKVITKLEQLKPEIEREEQEDQEVEAWRTELRRSFEELGKKLRQANTDLRSARRQMDMARLRKERAEEQDRRAQEAAGITSSISALSVALDAMNQQTVKLRSEAEMLQMKSSVLQGERTEDDPHVAVALNTARGKSTGGAKTLTERLAALEGDRARAPLAAAE